jgi:hypothetical protein
MDWGMRNDALVLHSTIRKKIMKDEQIQTLHPIHGKTNKCISLKKYHTIREHLLDILAKETYTHTELMEALYNRVKDTFEGGVQWYGETVKLDLEARQIIERTNTKPEKYRLVKPSKK